MPQVFISQTCASLWGSLRSAVRRPFRVLSGWRPFVAAFPFPFRSRRFLCASHGAAFACFSLRPSVVVNCGLAVPRALRFSLAAPSPRLCCLVLGDGIGMVISCRGVRVGIRDGCFNHNPHQLGNTHVWIPSAFGREYPRAVRSPI